MNGCIAGNPAYPSAGGLFPCSCLLRLLLVSATAFLCACSPRVREFSRGELPGEIAIGDLSGLYVLRPAEHAAGTGLTAVVRSAAPYPSWSPDGKRLVASSSQAEGDFPRHLLVYGRDSWVSQKFVETDSLVCYFPSWSPDGSKVAFFAERIGPLTWEEEPLFGKICVTDVQNGLPVQVTDVLSLPGRPSWSPDSKEIMFAATDSHVVTVDLAGKVTRRLGPGTDPAWSPDGATFAFYGRGGIYIDSVDGTGLRLVVPPERLWSRISYCGPAWPYTGGGITWSPDGEYFLYVGQNRLGRLFEYSTVVAVRRRDLARRPVCHFGDPDQPLGCSWTR